MNVIQDQHSDMVNTLVKPGVDILASLTAKKVNLWHAATGIVGEAGELIDAIKKMAVYNKPLDRDNVIEELGDIEFYLEQLRQGLDIERDVTLHENMAKLAKRYPGYSYSDALAAERLDKVAGE